jgi:putative hydrolase of HD superfamily
MDINMKRITKFLFEIGSLKKIARSHRQSFLTDDLSDNIASHSHRVSIIGYFLAVTEGVNVEKVLTMCIFHDVGESRSGNQNWVHKKYVKVFEDEILNDQLNAITQDNSLFKTMKEYAERESAESKIAKDADKLDQYLLVKEYIMRGNKEAENWIKKKSSDDLYCQTAKDLFLQILETDPSDWWKTLYTEKRR